MKTRIVLLPLGGTISMVTGAHHVGAIPKMEGAELIKSAAPSADIDVEIITRAPIASANVVLADLVDIVQRIDRAFAEGAAGAVITLGTDTLEEIAFALDLLTGCDRPIVLTGAMRFANQPGTDGPANLKAAIEVASDPDARGRGVLVVMSDEIHAARFVSKGSTTSTAAFSSSPFGAMGLVVEGRPTWAFRLNSSSIKLHAEPEPNAPQVPILMVGLGDDERVLRLLQNEPPDGLVVAALGAGHVPARLVSSLEALATKCPVVLASRISCGPTLTSTYGYPGAEVDLLARGLISSGLLSAPKAKVVLQIALSTRTASDDLKNLFFALQN